MPTINVNDLAAQYYLAYTTSERGFVRVMNLLDENANNQIDDWEIFMTYGIERTCGEVMQLLGMERFSSLKPNIMYFGDCPMTNAGIDLKSDSCPGNDDGDDTLNDAQLALDLYISLAFYFREDRDLIQKEESQGMFTQCTTATPVKTEITAKHNQATSRQLTENLRLFKSLTRNIQIDEALITETGPVNAEIEKIITSLPVGLFNDSDKNLLRSNYANGFLNDDAFEKFATIDFENLKNGAAEFNEITRAHQSRMRLVYSDENNSYSLRIILTTDSKLFETIDAEAP